MDFNLAGAIIRLVIFLPAVAVLAYLAVRYGLGQRMVTRSHSRNIRVLEQMPLGPRSTLSVIMVAGKYYLLSTSNEGQTKLICPIEDFPLPALTGEETDYHPMWQRWISRIATVRDGMKGDAGSD
ncbi:MAG: flagellar biosynthetic protein FliO [Bacillota bacterium]